MWSWLSCNVCDAKDPSNASGEADAHVMTDGSSDSIKLSMVPPDGADVKSDVSSEEVAANLARKLTRQRSMTARIDMMQAVGLFSRLTEDELLALAEACTLQIMEPGEVVIREGDPGFDFFLIQAGSAKVTVNEDPTFSVDLEAGHWFGERALIHDMPRMATVTASSCLALVKLNRTQFQELGMHEKVFTQARLAIHGGEICAGEQSVSLKRKSTLVSPATEVPDATEFCIEAMRQNKNLQSFLVHLTEAELRDLAFAAQYETVQNGTILIEQNTYQAEDDCLYIVKSGRFAVFNSTASEQRAGGRCTVCCRSSLDTARPASLQTVVTMTRGMSFGEISLLYAAARSATVQALEDSEVFTIDRSAVKKIIEMSGANQTKARAKCLRGVAMFEKLTEEELSDLAGVMHEFNYAKDDVIMQQGEHGDTFYVLVDGKVGVFKDDKLAAELEARQTDGTTHFFGERALLQKEPRAATIKVLSDSAFLLSCDCESFKYLLSGLFEVLQTGKRPANAAAKKSDLQDLVAKRISHFGKVKRKELKKVGILGFGGLGVIELREHVQTQRQFALKLMSKGYIKQAGLQKKIQHTRDVLIVLHSPFIIDLVEAYNSGQTLYFLMECCLGGDLLATYTKKGFYGSPVHCKFYIASLIMAFEHMHKFKIVYRDTKPENVMIDNVGTLKLVDMDCAKFTPTKTFTVCGTTEYFAPEMISMHGHTFGVDWWGVGILTFELLAGYTPFVADTPIQVYKKVAAGISTVAFPPPIKPMAKAFIEQLLVHSPSDRLPAKPGGIQQMKKMKFWQGVDWEKIKNQTAPPPYVPHVQAKVKAAKHFQPRPEDMPPQIVYEDDGSNWDEGFATSS